MADRNDSLVALFRELVQLTVLDEGSPNAFRVRAYENALDAISSYRGDLQALSEKELTAIGGIGQSTAKKIREFFQGGSIAKLDELRLKYPADFVELGTIPGLGPKTLLRLRSELGVRNLEDLRAALAGQKLRDVRGLGAKTEEKLLHAIGRMGAAGKDKRRPIAEAMPIARELVAALEALPEVERAQYCGSLRRLRETVADIDIVVASREPLSVRDALVKLKAVREVIGSGDTKTSVLTSTGLQVDLRIVEPRQFGAACQYFTGSKAHNIKLRQRALDRGWLLNEYGLSHAQTREDRVTLWCGFAQGIEGGRGFGGLAVARQLRGGFVFRAGCLRRLVAVMAVEAPAPRPGHDENSQGYQQISIFGPIPQDSVAADVFVDFAEKLGHLLPGPLDIRASQLACAG
jgi:DNA polymerase (family 10)